MSDDEFVLLYLSNGEQIITKILSYEDDNGYIVCDYPVSYRVVDTNVFMKRMIHLATRDPVTLNPEHVVAVSPPQVGLIRLYVQYVNGELDDRLPSESDLSDRTSDFNQDLEDDIDAREPLGANSIPSGPTFH